MDEVRMEREDADGESSAAAAAHPPKVSTFSG
jgi:hypothetical protein